MMLMICMRKKVKKNAFNIVCMDIVEVISSVVGMVDLWSLYGAVSF